MGEALWWRHERKVEREAVRSAFGYEKACLDHRPRRDPEGQFLLCKRAIEAKKQDFQGCQSFSRPELPPPMPGGEGAAPRLGSNLRTTLGENTLSMVERGGIALPKGKRLCKQESEALCPLGRVAQLHCQVRAKRGATGF